ncbi:MAG: hypothetical protein JO119_08890 [Acidobacteria bacterium]|nr:hypothetical protein [Acidobacteriota bacterium]
MHFRLLLVTVILLSQPLVIFARQKSSEDSVVHGTINIAFGNKQGIVVLTDSMLTASGAQLSTPGQKLFKLDARTVCSLAGFVSAPAGSGDMAIPDLNVSTAEIIRRFAQLSAAQPPQTIVEKVNALAYIINLRLSAIAGIRDVLGTGDITNAYTFQLIVAGYDVDGNPKIGKIALRTKNDEGTLLSGLEDGSLLEVKDKLVWKLNGMPDVAEELLKHPETKPRDKALVEYAAAMRENGGSSLTLQQMIGLAKRLAYYTSEAHPEVGGPSQIAILRKAHPVSIVQPTFPEPKQTLQGFDLYVQATYAYMLRRPVPDPTPMVFIRSTWIAAPIAIDYGYFIGDSFSDTLILYDGGPVSFGKSNHVTNSRLVIGPHAQRDSDIVKQLIGAFPWTRIDYQTPNPNF